ncbi:MAG: serine hydrolase, partial [Rivularia sp. (in: cyanobacteria)]
MSEPSYKFTASGRRQPTKRRQKVRKVQKPVGKQRPPQGGGTVSRVVISPSSSTAKKPRKRQRVE